MASISLCMIVRDEEAVLGCTLKDLMELGVKIGADVPYCVMGGTALAEGIGEKLTPLAPAPDCYVLVAICNTMAILLLRLMLLPGSIIIRSR